MFVEFFIRRPVFATVCALLIVLAGSAVLPTLPIAQFPNLAPPQVGVSSFYIGASAQTVESAVTIPLEQQINGAEGMKYITSTLALVAGMSLATYADTADKPADTTKTTVATSTKPDDGLADPVVAKGKNFEIRLRKAA